MDHTPKVCGPRARCRKYTTCATCAKIRQARFADRAEQAAKKMKIPTYYVLVPDDKSPKGIEYARRFFVRQNRPAAGVWSIESGAFQAGYHLNVIADWEPITAPFKGHIYQEPIRVNVRAVAAYITKAERAASKAEGFARQTGDLGHITDWMRKPDYNNTIIHAAQIQHEVAPDYLPESAPGPERHQDTARRWLDAIRQELKKERSKKETV